MKPSVLDDVEVFGAIVVLGVQLGISTHIRLHETGQRILEQWNDGITVHDFLGGLG
jgi:hypothetical protein